MFPVNRSDAELIDTNPVQAAFQKKRVRQAFSRDDARSTLIPAYMGLITELNDQVGRLMAHFDSLGQRDNTLIVSIPCHCFEVKRHYANYPNNVSSFKLILNSF